MTSTDSLRPILVATDDSRDVFTLWRYHKQCRIHNRLETVSDGEDVLRYLESCCLNYPLPALLIAALKLPRVGGVEILEHLEAARQREFPTVLMIGAQDYDLEVVMSAYRLGAHAFLVRPLIKNEFCGLMSRLEGIRMDGCSDGNGDAPGQLR